MITLIDRLGQIILFAYIIFGFGTLIVAEILLRRAFEEIGKVNTTREERVTTLHRIHLRHITCKKLQKNEKFKIAYFLLRLIRPTFVTFLVLILVIVVAKIWLK
jgi:hypothetical protein